MKHFIAGLILMLFFSCQPKSENTPGLHPGQYILTLHLDSARLPVRINIKNDSAQTIEIINNTERIKAEEIIQTGDSISIRFPVFNSVFKGTITSDSSFEGHWHNYAKGYFIPFTTERKDWHNKTNTSRNISGKWEATFSQGTPDEYKAIGIFEQSSDRLTGTFLTESGDYRYLEGEINNNHFYLSCFDGSHAFLFKGEIENDSVITNGRFYSGKSWSEPWNAKKNNEFELRDADSLTFLKPGYTRLAFTFPDLEKKPVSLTDQRFKDKVVIVQIMGSWCPNCLDESVFYTELYNKYRSQGLEIIALAYEHRPDFEYAKARVTALKKQLNSDYTFLIAGTYKKDEAAKTLPMLNHIMSFPTSIYLDRKGKIMKIHTGFSGPGTGKYYDEFKKETHELIEKLLSEK